MTLSHLVDILVFFAALIKTMDPFATAKLNSIGSSRTFCRTCIFLYIHFFFLQNVTLVFLCLLIISFYPRMINDGSQKQLVRLYINWVLKSTTFLVANSKIAHISRRHAKTFSASPKARRQIKTGKYRESWRNFPVSVNSRLFVKEKGRTGSRQRHALFCPYQKTVCGFLHTIRDCLCFAIVSVDSDVCLCANDEGLLNQNESFFQIELKTH